MKVCIVTMGIGAWYPRGVARLIQSFEQNSHGYQVMAYVNTLPPGAPERVILDGYDYTAYCAKPFALTAAVNTGADIVLWLDASIHAVRHIGPLINHISEHGYLLVSSGFTIGEWASDACLESMRLERGGVMDWTEALSGIVGLDVRSPAIGKALLSIWRDCWQLFPGAHSNDRAADKRHHYKNVGHCSDDPRCSGHRHDQTVLSILAHQLGLTNLVERPKFVAYKDGAGGAQNESTCLLIEGL